MPGARTEEGEETVGRLAREWGEFGLIAEIRRMVEEGAGHRHVALGIGDDTAVLDAPPGWQTLAACDTLIADVHFRIRPGHGYDTGRKAMAVNVSDIAAMGGVPTAALLGLAVSHDVSWPYLEDVLRGLRDEAREHGVAIVGGDTVSTPGPLVFHVTILGQVEQGRAVTRGGARPGDVIGVTGDLGASRAGLALLESPEPVSVSDEARAYAVARHLRPRPRLAAGRRLAALGATAMIDLSDGLAGDLRHVCQRSGVGAAVDAARLPIAAPTRAVAAAFQADPLRWALTGGEDFELLFTIPPDRWEDVEKALAPDLPVTLIGRVLEAREGIWLHTPGGPVPLEEGGFVHF